jgi:hypothetical protein
MTGSAVLKRLATHTKGNSCWDANLATENYKRLAMGGLNSGWQVRAAGQNPADHRHGRARRQHGGGGDEQPAPALRRRPIKGLPQVRFEQFECPLIIWIGDDEFGGLHCRTEGWRFIHFKRI